METKASIKGHPIHTILIPLPVGLWLFALVADVVALQTSDSNWRVVAYYCIAGGLVGALLAAVFGLVDLLGIRDPEPRRIGFIHMALNLVAVAVFAFNFYLRWNSVDGSGPWLLTLVGVLLLAVSGWLGGELVHRYGVSVLPEARR
jgi:uncharacterized membrane protein